MTLSTRHDRALEHAQRTTEYLAALEETIPDVQLSDWRNVEREWEERVLNLATEKNLESPYEMKQEKGLLLYIISDHHRSTVSSLVLSDKELLEKITQERGQTSSAIIGIAGVIQRGVGLQSER